MSVALKNGIIKVTQDDNGGFNVHGVFAMVVVAGVAPIVYKIAEDVLKESVNRANIRTGLLRSTGNVVLKGEKNPLIHMKLSNSYPKKRTPKGVLPGTVSIGSRESMSSVSRRILAQVMRSGDMSFTLVIGFHSNYAQYIHHGDWVNLGGKSQRANSSKRKTKSGVVIPSRYAGKIGKFFLKRAWVDNEGRYFAFIDAKIGR